MKRLDLVEVKWEDAMSSSGYRQVEDELERTNEDCLQYSIGHLIKKNKKHIVIAQTTVPIFDEVGKLFQIPIGMVRKITVLRKAKKNEQFQ